MSQPHKTLRVFVVDDEDVIASSLAMILRYNGGFHATSFNNPLEALQACRFEAPDLLITDVVMPQLSGVDLAIQVQQQCPNCKILLFSGQYATAHLLESAHAQGYDFEVLTKPVHPADLLAGIQSLTERTAPDCAQEFQAESLPATSQMNKVLSFSTEESWEGKMPTPASLHNTLTA